LVLSGMHTQLDTGSVDAVHDLRTTTPTVQSLPNSDFCLYLYLLLVRTTMQATDVRPKVGVGVLIFRGTDVLVGCRKGSHGTGTYALPGGHLELGESFEQCAIREVEEETGIQIRDPAFAYAVNSVFNETTHYVTVFMRVDVDQGVEPKLMEPDKCEGWSWVPWDAIPEPVFLPLRALKDSPYRPFG
ncbi:hypothetical protein Agub_g1468, partial [Astrephomene gubernaculifera]